MSTLLAKYRNQRSRWIDRRNARELQRAIDTAPSMSVRDDLVMAVQRQVRF
ncbi:MAG: hypothetical protein ACRDT8_19800 [Micromonosporaceae bacterium]